MVRLSVNSILLVLSAMNILEMKLERRSKMIVMLYRNRFGATWRKMESDSDQVWMDDINNFCFTSTNGGPSSLWKYDYES
jgi:hypothetical protein